MIKAAITISRVPEARGGPFVFWDDMDKAAAAAAQLGFHALELFPPDAESVDPSEMEALLARHQIALAAVGTGGGWVRHRLHLAHPDASVREQAIAFIGAVAQFAGRFGAQTIVGSMQGRADGAVTPDQAREWVAEALRSLAVTARNAGSALLLEPLNRYESNLFNTVGGTVTFLREHGVDDVRILADLFHMNIEEVSLPNTLRTHIADIGHVHFADSNRRAIGMGHTDAAAVAAALIECGYNGYVSGEILPLPDSDTAALTTINAFRRYFQHTPSQC
jgi:sugar phosphate isomerase/epimerase